LNIVRVIVGVILFLNLSETREQTGTPRSLQMQTSLHRDGIRGCCRPRKGWNRINMLQVRPMHRSDLQHVHSVSTLSRSITPTYTTATNLDLTGGEPQFSPCNLDS